MTRTTICGLSIALIFFVDSTGEAADNLPLAKALLFHASFDKSPDADVAKGDGRLYTAETLKRAKVQAGLHSSGVTLNAKDGRYGGYLEFKSKTKQIVFYKGGPNLPFASKSYQGAISFWLRLTPNEDLPAGFVNPLQITDKKWNDASMFVDFTKDKPRQFRLGVFSDYKFWNPKDRKWETIPEKERPLVTVKKPPFERTRWNHVAISYEGFNADKKNGRATLYLDGKRQGELNDKQRFSWTPDKVVIMLGINYVGGMDDLAIFNRSLSLDEVKSIGALPQGILSLK